MFKLQYKTHVYFFRAENEYTFFRYESNKPFGLERNLPLHYNNRENNWYKLSAQRFPGSLEWAIVVYDWSVVSGRNY